jgi:hypothetical protein
MGSGRSRASHPAGQDLGESSDLEQGYQMSAREIAVVAVLIGGVTITLMLPLFQYLAVGWRARRKDIMDGLSSGARHAYFRMFIQGGAQPMLQDAPKKFEDMYAHWYGRRYFIVRGAHHPNVDQAASGEGISRITQILDVCCPREGSIMKRGLEAWHTAGELG